METVKETAKETDTTKVTDPTQGLYYDPPGSTITTDKEITPHHKRTFYFMSSGVYASNEFEGARLNDFYKVDQSVYTAVFLPENAPVNNSAWYAFKLWADTPQSITVNLEYKDGTHRYYPKLSNDGMNWRRIDSTDYSSDTTSGTAKIKVNIGPDTLWVSAQELFTSSDYESWINQLLQNDFIKKEVIGKSSSGKPINKLIISGNTESNDYLVVIGRLHPPEVTGGFALKGFIETIAGKSELAQNFRKHFKTFVVPLVNPDGVDDGHWRHNAHGIDLNRDWYYFNQPEPKAVADELLRLKNEEDARFHFFIDFHSTQVDVFYTTGKDTTKDNDEIYELQQEWLNELAERNPDYHVNVDESLNNPNTPTSDTWSYNNLAIPSVTYEIGDETEREQIKKISTSAAEIMMELLLQKESASSN